MLFPRNDNINMNRYLGLDSRPPIVQVHTPSPKGLRALAMSFTSRPISILRTALTSCFGKESM
ncbi:MAG: hypothetical protein V5B36_07055 [Candidatus Accumulibacter sp. UW25]|jgi:hypothetical protein